VTPDRPRKSSGSETTFEHDLTTPEAVLDAVHAMADHVWDWVERTRVSGKTVTVKVRYADFRIVTRSKTLERAVASHADLIAVAERLVATLFPLQSGIRLVGVTLASIEGLEEGDQLALPVA
jgi:DNA polymerase-4